jgi:hypothetical protein
MYLAFFLYYSAFTEIKYIKYKRIIPIVNLCLLDMVYLSHFLLFINSGRALEELRASLFNEFRSSEAVKRQQQSRCGPIAALTFNFLVAVGIIFMNKLVRIVTFLYI